MLCQIQILVCQPWSKLGLLLPILGDGNGNTQSIFIRIRIPIERNPIHDGGMTIALKYRALTMAHVNLRNMRVCLRHVLLHNFLPSVDWWDQHWSTMKPRNLLVVALRVLGGWLQHTCHAKVRATWHRLNWGLARLVGLLPKRRWLVMLSQNQWGGPKHRWFILENPIKMDDFGVPSFLETSNWLLDQLKRKRRSQKHSGSGISCDQSFK